MYYTVVGYDHLLYGLLYTLNVKKLADLSYPFFIHAFYKK